RSCRFLSSSPVTLPPTSMGWPCSFLSLHWPIALKFSIAKPMVSIFACQFAHAGSARCCSSFCRKLPESSLRLLSSMLGTFGGGGGGGSPSNCSRIHLPRFTGEVRVGFDVTVSTLACVSRPPRGVTAGETRVKLLPSKLPGGWIPYTSARRRSR